MREQRVDRKTLEHLLQELLFLQYRFEFMRRSSAMRSDSNADLYMALEVVSERFDRLIGGFVDVPAVGAFKHEKKSHWLEKIR